MSSSSYSASSAATLDYYCCCPKGTSTHAPQSINHAEPLFRGRATGRRLATCLRLNTTLAISIDIKEHSVHSDVEPSIYYNTTHPIGCATDPEIAYIRCHRRIVGTRRPVSVSVTVATIPTTGLLATPPFVLPCPKVLIPYAHRPPCSDCTPPGQPVLDSAGMLGKSFRLPLWFISDIQTDPKFQLGLLDTANAGVCSKNCPKCHHSTHETA